MGAPSTITGRLLTYEEADSAQNIEDTGTSIIFNGSDYWLGSAQGGEWLWSVYHDSDSISSTYHYISRWEGALGVRPVIEIPTSALQ